MSEISNISDNATEAQNSPNTLTPILEYQPEDKVTSLIKNAVQRGQQTRGFPAFAKLYNTNGNLIDPKSRLAFGFEAANADTFQVVSVPFESVRPYNATLLNDQQNGEFIDRFKHKLNAAADQALAVEHAETLYVLLDSPDTIDWNQGSCV